MSDARYQLHARRLERNVERVEGENERLKSEARVLREQAHGDRDELKRLIAALEGLGSPAKHRLRRTLALAAAAGGAYVLGAKAGRRRYEQIRSRWDQWSRRASGKAVDLQDRVDDGVGEAQVMTDRLGDAAELAAETARSVVERPAPSAGRQTSGSVEDRIRRPGAET